MTPYEIIAQIARDHLSIPTLHARNSDNLDFHVWPSGPSARRFTPPIWPVCGPDSPGANDNPASALLCSGQSSLLAFRLLSPGFLELLPHL